MLAELLYISVGKNRVISPSQVSFYFQNEANSVVRILMVTSTSVLDEALSLLRAAPTSVNYIVSDRTESTRHFLTPLPGETDIQNPEATLVAIMSD